MSNAIVYEHIDFNGAFQELTVGDYNLEQLIFGNDKISSLKVPFGMGVQLFWDRDFRGADVIYEYGDHRYIGDGWNDKTSSIRVHPRTVLFKSTDDGDVPSSVAALFDGVFIGLDGNTDSLNSTHPIFRLLPGDKKKRYFKTLTATIPEGKTVDIWECTGNGVREGRAGWNKAFDEDTRILTVVVWVVPRELFGTRNWVGVEMRLRDI
jgi:hypothetical protein